MLADIPPDCSAMTVTFSQFLEAAEPRVLIDDLRQRGECEQLAAAQWSPIKQVAKAGRELRRVSFLEGRAAYTVNVAMEKDDAGRVEVRLTTSRSVLSAPVPLAAWHAFVAGDSDARDLPPLPPSVVSPPPPFHCPMLTIEVSRKAKSRVRHVSQCNSRDTKAWAYAIDLAKVAATFIPACKQATAAQTRALPTNIEPIDQLVRCGGAVDRRSF